MTRGMRGRGASTPLPVLPLSPEPQLLPSPAGSSPELVQAPCPGTSHAVADDLFGSLQSAASGTRKTRIMEQLCKDFKPEGTSTTLSFHSRFSPTSPKSVKLTHTRATLRAAFQAPARGAWVGGTALLSSWCLRLVHPGQARPCP